MKTHTEKNLKLEIRELREKLYQAEKALLALPQPSGDLRLAALIQETPEFYSFDFSADSVEV